MAIRGVFIPAKSLSRRHTSRNPCGIAASGYLVEVEKVSLARMEE